jgi:DMSO/TMAO reductase YedYZ molybdopterin-dependent catalytic subunit
MRNFQRSWLLLLSVLTAALLLSCQMTVVKQLPEQTPTEEPAMAESDNSDQPLTPIEKMGITGVTQYVDITTYRLTINGLVEKPLSLTYQDILAYPSVTVAAWLICPNTFADYAKWTGVPVSTILAAAGIKAGASNVTFYAVDGYHIMRPLSDVLREGVFLAYNVNGQVLPAEHGYPLRLVLKDEPGGAWIKWVERIEVN